MLEATRKKSPCQFLPVAELVEKEGEVLIQTLLDSAGERKTSDSPQENTC